MSTARTAGLDAGRAGTSVADRRDPAVRRRLSGPGLRAFFGLADRWQLGAEEQRGLLGWPSRSTFFAWKAGKAGTLPFDTLTRLSLVLGIYKALHVLYPDEAFADGWVRMPNRNPIFRGAAPLVTMVEGGIDALYAVRRLLDGRRGGWH
ncbi:MAG: antitoxin Xre-like helix-turn-helix domain-containing protein [Candidatus Binatia bacterium]